MIGHHYSREKFVLAAVVSETAIKNNLPRSRRKVPATGGGKRDEQRSLVLLKVRELSPVAIFRFQEHRVESRAACSRRQCRPSLQFGDECCGTGSLVGPGLGPGQARRAAGILAGYRPPSFARLDGSETRPYTIIFNNLAPLNPPFPHSTPIFSPSLPFACPSRYGSITSI